MKPAAAKHLFRGSGYVQQRLSHFPAAQDPAMEVQRTTPPPARLLDQRIDSTPPHQTLARVQLGMGTLYQAARVPRNLVPVIHRSESTTVNHPRLISLPRGSIENRFQSTRHSQGCSLSLDAGDFIRPWFGHASSHSFLCYFYRRFTR